MTSELSVANLSPSPGAPGLAESAEPASELGKDAFLELLIAQIQNQNPLDPSDPSEFLGQLASFTSLEQMAQLNDGVESLAMLQATGLSLENVNLVGKTVVYQTNQAAVSDDGEARFRINTSAPAPRMVVEYNDGGLTKTTEISNVRAGDNDVTLDGLTGPTVEVLSVTGYSGDEMVDMSIRTYSVNRVDGVTFEGGSPKLMSGSVLRIDPSEVVEILAP